MLIVPAKVMASGDSVLQDCADDSELSRTYSQAEYKKALADLPADLDEYTDCRAIIKAAQLKNATKSGGSSGSGTGTPKRKQSKRETDKISKDIQNAIASQKALKLGSARVTPGSLDSSSSIPAPLVVVLILALLGALAASAIAIRRFVLSRRNS